MAPPRHYRPLAPPAVVLGVGLGGFVDGIVLHQILQWHHLLTARRRFPADTVVGLEDNTLADGLFHAAAWVAVLIGVVMLWRAVASGRAGRPTWRTLGGGLALGWGVFNLVEGVADHHLLRLHHVRDDVAHPLPWDLGFLAYGAALVLIGLALVRRDGPDHDGADRRVDEGSTPR